MANTTRNQFKTLIVAFEANKHLDNDLCTLAMQEAEPSLKLTTVQVYRSNIENFSMGNGHGASVSEKFITEMESYYFNGEPAIAAVNNAGERDLLEENRLLKLEVEKLLAQNRSMKTSLILIKNDIVEAIKEVE